jgi:hypothetical protein
MVDSKSSIPQDAPVVDGCLSYVITVNMKVEGTLGDERTITVQPSPAVLKIAPAAPVGLLNLHRHAHLKVLEFLKPNWVQGGREGIFKTHSPSHPHTMYLIPSFRCFPFFLFLCFPVCFLLLPPSLLPLPPPTSS